MIFLTFFLPFSGPAFLSHFVDFGDLWAPIFEHFDIMFAYFFRRGFRFDFSLIFEAVLASFWDVFRTLFPHLFENVDFVKIAVLLQENKLFHGSEGSKIDVQKRLKNL